MHSIAYVLYESLELNKRNFKTQPENCIIHFETNIFKAKSYVNV